MHASCYNFRGMFSTSKHHMSSTLTFLWPFYPSGNFWLEGFSRCLHHMSVLSIHLSVQIIILKMFDIGLYVLFLPYNQILARVILLPQPFVHTVCLVVCPNIVWAITLKLHMRTVSYFQFTSSLHMLHILGHINLTWDLCTVGSF